MNLTRTLRRRALPAPHDTAADPVPGPPDVEVAARHLRIGDDYAATLAVTGYPAEVAPGWLEPLLSYPGRLDVALHIDPVPPAAAADRLRRQRARLESGRRAGADRGQLDDPDTEAAAGDARDLAYRLARGEGKLFRLGLYLTVHAASEDDLAEEVAAVRAVASSLLLVTAPATFRSLQGWVTTLPAGTDALKLTRTMDTAALAAAFPFTSPDLPRDPADPDPLPGILYGANTAGPGLVAWDRWAQRQPQLRHPRRLRRGEVLPGQARGPAQRLPGHRVLDHRPRRRIRPPRRRDRRRVPAPRRRRRPAQPLRPPGAHARCPAARGRADPPGPVRAHRHRGAARRAARPGGAGRAGPGHHGRLPPRRDHLRSPHLGAARPPARRTWPPPCAPTPPRRRCCWRTGWCRSPRAPTPGCSPGRPPPAPPGTWSCSPSATSPTNCKAVATLLALDTVWRQVSDPAARRRRLVVVDEAWLLMRNPEGAKFLFRMAKAARKHWAGLAVVTQDAEDVLGSDLGRAVIANAATQVLLRQAPQAIDLAADAFRLSAGEKALLLSAGRGEGLLACGPSARVSFQALASPAEHLLCTSDPAELAALEAAGVSRALAGPGRAGR